MATATAEEYAELLGASADEVEETQGGSEFPDVWDFKKDGQDKLVGIYLGSKQAGKKNSNLYSVHPCDAAGTIEKDDDGEDKVLTFWGTAVLDSRMEPVEEGDKILVHRTGEWLDTSSGNKAQEFKVIIARSAVG